MAKKQEDPDESMDLSLLMPTVEHLPVRSLPFNLSWYETARKKWLALKAQGVQQDDFAAWCGCRQGTVSNVLGEKLPVFWRCDYLERFSAALEIQLPMKAQLEVVTDEIGDDEVGLAKVLDLIHWVREQRR